MIFVSNWSFGYWQAWVYVAITVAALTAIYVYLRVSDPELLARRKRGPGSESSTGQKLVQLGAIIVFAGTPILASYDHRSSWSHVPALVSIAGDCLLVVSFLILLAVLRANSFAAANIAVEADQKVISTGPYAIVRHPYYTGLLLWPLATALALGSWWATLTVVPMALLLAYRIDYEERFLTEKLPGYEAYRRSVRFRLVPQVW
jgi:protein-S-isoprenylcysteine O-methyltransferase Ste14